MKKIIFGSIAILLLVCGIVYARQSGDLDDKEFSSISFASGKTTLAPASGKLSNTTVTIPNETGTVITSGVTTKILPATGINWTGLNIFNGSGINWTGSQITGQGINWTDIRAYGTSHGGDHSGINWQSFGI